MVEVRARVALAVIAVAIGGCFPTYDFGSGTDGGSDATLPGDDVDASTDATLDGVEGSPPGADATTDTTLPDGRVPDTTPGDDATLPTLTATPYVLLDGVSIATETGMAQQRHLFFAVHSNRYWMLSFGSDATSVVVRWSTDLTTWNDGGSITLPDGHGGEGRNLAVAYVDRGGVDLVHVGLSLHDAPRRRLYEARGTISGATATFGAPVLVHDSMNDPSWSENAECDPDGTSVTVGADGRVYVASAWVAVQGCCQCDSNVFESGGVDQGAAWDAGAWALHHFTVEDTSNARQLVSLSNGDVLFAYENGADIQIASDEQWSRRAGGTWSTDTPLFADPDPPGERQEENDWSLCRIDDAHIHAVRRHYVSPDGGGTSSVFEHDAFTGGSWAFASTMPAEASVAASGVVVLTNGHGLLAATIAADSSVMYATWDTSKWSAWSPLVPADAGAAQRRYLSGTGCEDPAHPIVMWTEGSTAPYRVVGVPVHDLIP